MNRSIEFYLGISREMKALKCSEMYINVDDMDEIITRLRQAEKDAARYRWLRCELEQSQGSIALFDGECHVCDIDLFIDEPMQCDEAMQCNN